MVASLVALSIGAGAAGSSGCVALESVQQAAAGRVAFAARPAGWQQGAELVVDMAFSATDTNENRCVPWCSSVATDSSCRWCRCSTCVRCNGDHSPGTGCRVEGNFTTCWGASVLMQGDDSAVLRLGSRTSDGRFGCSVVHPIGARFTAPTISCKTQPQLEPSVLTALEPLPVPSRRDVADVPPSPPSPSPPPPAGRPPYRANNAARIQLGLALGHAAGVCLACTQGRARLAADIAAALRLEDASYVRVVEVRGDAGDAEVVIDLLPTDERSGAMLVEQAAALLPVARSDLFGGDLSQFIDASKGLLRLGPEGPVQLASPRAEEQPHGGLGTLLLLALLCGCGAVGYYLFVIARGRGPDHAGLLTGLLTVVAGRLRTVNARHSKLATAEEEEEGEEEEEECTPVGGAHPVGGRMDVPCRAGVNPMGSCTAGLDHEMRLEEPIHTTAFQTGDGSTVFRM